MFTSFFARFLVLCALAAAVFLPLIPAGAQTDAAPVKPANRVDSATFELRWIKPSELAGNIGRITETSNTGGKSTYFLPLPSGITRMSPDDTTRRITVYGTTQAVTTMQEIVRLLDVEPRRVRFSVRVLRAPALYDFASVPAGVHVDLGDPGTHLAKSEVVTTAVAACSNNETITLNAVGDGRLFRVQVTSHLNGDESVSVTAGFLDVPLAASVTFPSEETPKEAPATRRIWTKRTPNGVSILLDVLPFPKDKKMAYYLELTPVVAPRTDQ